MTRARSARIAEGFTGKPVNEDNDDCAREPAASAMGQPLWSSGGRKADVRLDLLQLQLGRTVQWLFSFTTEDFVCRSLGKRSVVSVVPQYRSTLGGQLR